MKYDYQYEIKSDDICHDDNIDADFYKVCEKFNYEYFCVQRNS